MIEKPEKESWTLIDEFESDNLLKTSDIEAGDSISNIAINIKKRRTIDPNFDLVYRIFLSSLRDLGAIKQKGRKNSIRRRHWTNAKEWILSESEGLHSFRWAVEVLGIDPDGVIRALEALRCHYCFKKILKDFCVCRWQSC